MSRSVNVLIPVYNDWQSLELLMTAIAEENDERVTQNLSFTIINDASATPMPKFLFDGKFEVEVVHLNRNLGHQRAIATGIAYISQNKDYDAVIVMDSDGEDRPGDIKHLIAAFEDSPNRIIFAKRTRRQESRTFKLFYKIYKVVHKLLTGKPIAFGNFSIIPGHLLPQVSNVSEIWSHYSGGIIRSKIPFTTIPLERGKRLAGESKMNFTSLILHGLSSISVSSDIMAIRMLIVSLLCIGATAAAIMGVTGIRLFTDLAIPGWASMVVIGLAVILMQMFLISLFLVFTVLTYRMQQFIIPSKHYSDYIGKVEYFGANERREVPWEGTGTIHRSA